MPTSARTPCRYIGCPRTVVNPGYCPLHERAHKKADAARYPHSPQHNSLYGRRWRTVRNDYLRAHPLCVRCAVQGREMLASVVDHIKPHKGDMSLFHDSGNFESLCRACHDWKTSACDGGYGNKIKNVIT